MALASALQQLMLIWGGGGVVTVQYMLPIKPNSRINNYFPSGRGYSDNLNAKILTYKPSSRGISNSPSGCITSIIPNAH